jgi:hypothetical protein
LVGAAAGAATESDAAPIAEPTGELGWSLRRGAESAAPRAPGGRGDALRVELGEHPTAAAATLTIVLEF